jgi:hypothetical protein
MASIAGIRVCWQNQNSALLPFCSNCAFDATEAQSQRHMSGSARSIYACQLVQLATYLGKPDSKHRANRVLSTGRMTTGGEPVERFPMPSVRRVASELKAAAPAVRDMAMRVWCVFPHALRAFAGLCSCQLAHAISWHARTVLQAAQLDLHDQLSNRTQRMALRTWPHACRCFVQMSAHRAEPLAGAAGSWTSWWHAACCHCRR